MKTSVPLTKVQSGIYAECVTHQGEIRYQIMRAYTLDGSLDGERLCRAIEAAVKNHPTLFTRIRLDEKGNPTQCLDEALDFRLECLETSDIATEKERFVQPFDLYKDRLFRIRLLKDTGHYYLLLNIHHIISDGTSIKNLMDDVERAYEGFESQDSGFRLEPEQMTMMDVARAEEELRATAAFDEARKWYAEEFGKADCYSQLPVENENENSTEEMRRARVLSVDVERVDAFCRENGIYRSQFFTSAYGYLLARYNGERRALFATSFNGRGDKRFAHSVGMTVKRLPVYATFDRGTTVTEFIKAGQQQMTGCREHEAYAYSDVVNDLKLRIATTFVWHASIFENTPFCGKLMKLELLRNNSRENQLYVKALIRNGQLVVEAEYNTANYSEALIDRFLDSYEAVVAHFLEHPADKVSRISIVSKQQEEELRLRRQTATGDASFKFFHECISHFARKQPEQEALVACDATYTYKEMDELTNRIANGLRQKGVKDGDRVALLLPRTSRLILSMFGVMKAGAAYIPCDPDYPEDRVRLILEDSGAKIIVTPELAEELLLTDDISLPHTNITSDDLAYLIYTSGSTGRPKGVMLRHEGICNYLYGHPANVFANVVMTDANRILSVTTISFDAALQDIGMAYYNGKTLVLATEDQANNPIELSQLILKQHIDMVSGTPSRWLTWLTSNDFAHAIAGIKIARAGGEKFSDQLLEQMRKVTSARIFNCYGPTEITVASNNAELTNATRVTVGRPQLNVKEFVVDSDGNELPVGVVGELYIGGKGVARGYNNLDEMTRERFIDYLGERIYRSGDYAKWLPDGNVVILGRTDHQIKLRGLRIELGEIENVILQVEGVKQVVVAIREIGGMEHLCAYFTADRDIDTAAMKAEISSHLTDYMVPTAYMQMEAIPMTPNGKTDIKALPQPKLNEELRIKNEESATAPRRLTRLEKELQAMVADVIGIEGLDVEYPLGMAGLTSLTAIRLAILVQQRYGVAMKAKQMVKNSCILSIEDEIISEKLRVKSEEFATATPTADGTAQPDSSLFNLHSSFPLSYAQTGVYVDCLKNPEAIQYNIPHLITFSPTVTPQELAEAIKTLVGKHPQMKAHFGQDETGFIQTIDTEQVVEIPIQEMSREQLAQYKQQFVRPFNLATGPLYRFTIVTTGQSVCLLMDVHHLVFDGSSTAIFVRQLCALLNNEAIEDEKLPYSAYVADEQTAKLTEEYQAANDFFKEQLAAVEAATEVRPDLPNPAKGLVSRTYSTLDMGRIEEFCRQQNITPASLTIAAVYYALSRFANSEQVCITTVSNGRSDLRIAGTVGMFVNTLALGATIGKQSVKEFLHEVSENFFETLLHENYPFAQIAADYGLTPEIQFVYQLGMAGEYVAKGTPLKMELLEVETPKFPITFFIMEHDGQPSVSVAYDDGKYSKRLMQSLADAVKATVERMMDKPDAALTSICIVSDKEAERIIKMGTGKEIDVDLSKTFANLFTEQAQRTPDAPAVVDRDSQLTYGEMDRYSNALARRLIDFGVRPDDFVCVMLDRFKEFPLAVLSIHKAGAAYTPLDFEYPNERLSYMLENSESKVLITSHDVLEAKMVEGDFSTAAAKTFFIDDFMADVPEAEPIDLSSPDGLAYMIYTSGSTGKPKGAMLHQAGLRNFIAVVIDMEKLTAADRISGHRSFSFDAHIEDMYPVLTLGGSFHIMPTEIRKDLTLIRQFLIDHQCTGGGYSTAMTCLLLNTFDDLPIRFTTGGGEKMDGVYSDHIEIINVYGPTECTDDTSYYAIAPGCRVENIPIGESVANNWNFIVDTSGNLVPQGVAGELCFAGIQVGRGYWRLPERTAKSFVDCQFVKQDRWGRPVRMYHTGDLCRWNEDGQIEYLGRIDTQVKLRGFRIELGEIESKALNLDGIRQAAAEVRKVQGNEHLVLYYTTVDGSTIDNDDIISALKASSLAEYMVPDVYMKMAVMPMTPNGKINRKALPAPELQRTTEYVAPVGEMEELFCAIFSDILKIPEVGATDNFFEIGGTSINAIKVIVEASKHGAQIVFNDLFNLKTPRALATYVGRNEASTAPADSPTDSNASTNAIAATSEAEHFAPLNAFLAANTLDNFREGKHQPIGDVLLTGATGYLGIHILNELLTNYHGKILCPVRAKGNDEALSRIKTLYFYYFGHTKAFSHFDERVNAFSAEVTQANAYDHLNKAFTVINCVANVKHFSAGNDIEMVNIESVRHLVAFCQRTGSRLIHISTSSVAGLSYNDDVAPDARLTEQDFYIGQHVEDRKYTYSKFKAEELVLDAIVHHGLNAKIMRVGNLSARQKDGELQINFNTNNFLALLRAYVVIGMIPYNMLDRQFEFSPIDEVARAIMMLAQTPKKCVVFHPFNNHRQFLSDILSGFAEAGIKLRRVENEEYQQALEKMMDNPDLIELVRPLMAYNLGGSRKVRPIEATNSYTMQVLYRMGFQWPTTAADYVHRFVDTIVGFDFFNVK